MRLQTLFTFSRHALKHTQQPVSFYFWSWLGWGILLKLCCMALCLAAQIGFTFLSLLPYLEIVWYGLRLLFAAISFFVLTPFWYRFLYYSAKAADLAEQALPEKKTLFYRSFCLRGMRFLPILPLPFCLWGVIWCLQQGIYTPDAVLWFMAAGQFVALAGVCMFIFFWMLPALTAAAILCVASSERKFSLMLRGAFQMVSGKRKTWYRLCFRMLPMLIVPFFWKRAWMTMVVYFGVQQKEAQYTKIGGNVHGTSTDMACDTKTACHNGTILKKRKKRFSETAHQTQTQ